MSNALPTKPHANAQDQLTLASNAVYSALKAHLSTHADTVLSIEILPSSHVLPPNTPFLHDGPSLGIPKKTLQQAWLVARKVLEASITSNPKASTTNVEWEALDTATRIVILHTPEHLTAANGRKRLLRSRGAVYSSQEAAFEPPGSIGSDDFLNYLRDEFAFSTTLLTSPLPSHAKSPTLWYHRFWLVKSYTGYFLSSSAEDWEEEDVRSSFFAKEIEVVLKAAGEHRGNYHAFLYGRRLHMLLALRRMRDEGEGYQAGHVGGLGLERVCFKMQKWCFAHPRDVSGWAFLAFLLGHVGEGETKGKVVTGVRRFVEDLRWEGKCVEWFLVTVEEQVDEMDGSKVEGTRHVTEGIAGRRMFTNS